MNKKLLFFMILIIIAMMTISCRRRVRHVHVHHNNGQSDHYVEETYEPAGEIVVEIAPPAPRYETRTVCPGPHHQYVWIAGHWAWRHGQYVWVAGHWKRKRGKNAHWVAGHWKKRGRHWVWVPGHWR